MRVAIMGKGQYGILFRPRDAHVKFVTKVYGLIAFGGFGQFRKRSQSLNAHVFRHLLDVIVRLFLVMIVYNMADLFFIGRLGDTAQVGAISIVGPVFLCTVPIWCSAEVRNRRLVYPVS